MPEITDNDIASLVDSYSSKPKDDDIASLVDAHESKVNDLAKDKSFDPMTYPDENLAYQVWQKQKKSPFTIGDAWNSAKAIPSAIKDLFAGAGTIAGDASVVLPASLHNLAQSYNYKQKPDGSWVEPVTNTNMDAGANRAYTEALATGQLAGTNLSEDAFKIAHSANPHPKEVIGVIPGNVKVENQQGTPMLENTQTFDLSKAPDDQGPIQPDQVITKSPEEQNRDYFRALRGFATEKQALAKGNTLDALGGTVKAGNTPQQLAQQGAVPINPQDVTTAAGAINPEMFIPAAVPGAAVRGFTGGILKGTGKALQIPSAIADAVANSKVLQAAADTAGTAGKVIGAKPGLIAKGAGILAKVTGIPGQFVEGAGDQLLNPDWVAPDATNAIASRAANDGNPLKDVWSGSQNLAAAKQVGRAAIQGPLSGAIAMAPLNAVTSDTPQEFGEKEASAAGLGMFGGLTEAKDATSRDNLTQQFGKLLQKEGGTQQFGTGWDEANAKGIATMQPEEQNAFNKLRGFLGRLRTQDGTPVQAYALNQADYSKALVAHGQEGGDDTRGFISPNGKQIFVNTDAAPGDSAGTLAHEGTHAIETLAQIAAPKLADGLLRNLRSNLYDNKGNPAPDFQTFIDNYNKSIGGDALAANTPEARQKAESEFLAETGRAILSGGNIEQFGLPQTITQKLKDGASSWMQNTFGIQPKEGSIGFGGKEIANVTKGLRDVFFGVGGDVAKGISGPSKPTGTNYRLDQLNSVIQKGLPENAAPEQQYDFANLVKERDTLARTAAANQTASERAQQQSVPQPSVDQTTAETESPAEPQQEAHPLEQFGLTPEQAQHLDEQHGVTPEDAERFHSLGIPMTEVSARMENAGNDAVDSLLDSRKNASQTAQSTARTNAEAEVLGHVHDLANNLEDNGATLNNDLGTAIVQNELNEGNGGYAAWSKRPFQSNVRPNNQPPLSTVDTSGGNAPENSNPNPLTGVKPNGPENAQTTKGGRTGVQEPPLADVSPLEPIQRGRGISESDQSTEAIEHYANLAKRGKPAEKARAAISRDAVDAMAKNRGNLVWVQDYASPKASRPGETRLTKQERIADADTVDARLKSGEYTKQDIPVVPVDIKMGKERPYVRVFRPDVWTNNLHHVMEAASEKGLNPLDDLKGADLDAAVQDAMEKYTRNHVNGFDGAGLKSLKAPGPDYNFKAPEKGAQPEPLDSDPAKAQQIADMLNMALGSDSNSLKTAKGALNAFGKKAQAFNLENAGFRNDEEFNALRSQLPKSVAEKLSNPFTEIISPEAIKGRVTTEPPNVVRSVRPSSLNLDYSKIFANGRPSSEASAAGFMPKEVAGSSREEIRKERDAATAEVQKSIQSTKDARTKGIRVDEDENLSSEDSPYYNVWHPDSDSTWGVYKNDSGKWRGENNGSYTTDYDNKEEAINDAKERVADEVNSSKGVYGDDLDNSYSVSPIFEKFAVPPQVSDWSGWFRTKWGSWYANGKLDGKDIKLSIRDHDATRKDMGLPTKSVEVSKNWTPKEVNEAVGKIEDWLWKKASFMPNTGKPLENINPSTNQNGSEPERTSPLSGVQPKPDNDRAKGSKPLGSVQSAQSQKPKAASSGEGAQGQSAKETASSIKSAGANGAGNGLTADGYTWTPSSRSKKSGDVSVKVDVSKLDKAWKSDPVYVSPGSDKEGKVKKFSKWITANPDQPVEMPEMDVNEKGKPGFTDGRHRFAFMRDNGAKEIYVSVPKESTSRVKELFGVGSTSTSKTGPLASVSAK